MAGGPPRRSRPRSIGRRRTSGGLPVVDSISSRAFSYTNWCHVRPASRRGILQNPFGEIHTNPQEHLLHVGQSLEPVYWTLCGFASGYLSCSAGRPIYCVEERCRAKGDALCLMVGDTAEAWAI